jgi:hypothetical protein
MASEWRVPRKRCKLRWVSTKEEKRRKEENGCPGFSSGFSSGFLSKRDQEKEKTMGVQG